MDKIFVLVPGRIFITFILNGNHCSSPLSVFSVVNNYSHLCSLVIGFVNNI